LEFSDALTRRRGFTSSSPTSGDRASACTNKKEGRIGMPSRSRVVAGAGYKILGVSVLLSLLFITGCKTKEPAGAEFYISSPESLPSAAVSVGGGTYSATLQAAGGVTPYSWALVNFNTLQTTTNLLPPGLTLSSSGGITGMPSAPGTYSFSVQVTDAAGLTMTATEKITITAPLVIGTSGTTLRNIGIVGASYQATSLGITGGFGTITCTVNSGALPAGLNLTNVTGAWAISGTVATSAATGPNTFALKCTDTQGDSLISGPIIITVNAAGPAAGVRGAFSLDGVDEPCGSGNEAILSGPYAFLVRGASASNEYKAVIGSFTANGSGGITGGLMDSNGTAGPATGMTINSAGSSFSVGADNRGCLTLMNSSGATLTFRVALGMLSGSPSTATQGSMTVSIDNTGQGFRGEGILMQQDVSAFHPGEFKGTYVFGREGIDASGGRYAVAGLYTADGNGNLTRISADSDDAFAGATTVSGGSGTYTIATSGRGTSTITIDGQTSNLVTYSVSSSEQLSLSADFADLAHPIQSGENKLQTMPTFPAYLPDGSEYAFYATGIDSSNGGSTALLGQATFNGSSGNATVTLDVNDNGVEATETIGQAVFVIAPNGRMTAAGQGPGNNPPVIYLVDQTRGFLVGTDPYASSGYIQQQTGGPFSTASISGQAFFGGSALAAGSSYDSGTITFQSSSSTITGTDDGSSPAFNSMLATPVTYAFSANSSFTPTAPGQGLFGNTVLAYIVSTSPLKVIFMQLGTTPQNPNASPAELFIGQQ
jgi:hypothetical protein